jgi:hypothetical protein
MIWGFKSRQGLGIFLFTTASRPVLGPTQPPIQSVPGALSLGIKLPVCETNHLPSSSAEVKECVEFYLHSTNTHLWRGAQFKKKAQGQLTFTFTLMQTRQNQKIFLLLVSFPSFRLQKCRETAHAKCLIVLLNVNQIMKPNSQ